MTGSGKSLPLQSSCSKTLRSMHPQTYIFDIGGSFQSLTTIFGGTYLNVGQDSRDFTINPFSLAPTKENLQFLFSFFRVLIEGTEQRYRLDFKEERKLWDAIERMYVLEPEQRTLSNFANIIGELKERLASLDAGGQYGFLFDNAEDTLIVQPASRPSTSPAGVMRRRCWSHFSSMSSIGRRTRSPTRRSSRRSRCSCWTRLGSSSRTRRSATTSSRHRRPGANTMPRWFLPRSPSRNLKSRGCCRLSRKAARRRSSSPTLRWIATSTAKRFT